MSAANAAHALMWLILCKGSDEGVDVIGHLKHRRPKPQASGKDTSEHGNATDCRQQNLIHLESPVCSATIIA
jgi:hypothetical protein